MTHEPPRGRPRAARSTFLEELYRKYIETPAGGAARPVPGDALVVGRDPVTEVARYFTPDDLFLHLHAIGMWGSGKSNFLRRLCHQLVRRKRRTGCGFALIDPHGDAAEYVLALIASQAPALAPEVFYLDFSNTHPVLGIDPLRVYEQDQGAYYTACAAAEATLKAFGALNSQDLPQLRRVLVALYEALIYTGLSVSDARYFLFSGDSDRAVLRGVLDRMPLDGVAGVTRGFWEHYLKQPAHTADNYAAPPLNRLDPLMKTPVLKRLVSGATIGLDFKDLMDRGGIGLFNLGLSKGSGVTVDAQHLFAALLVQQFRQVIPQRTPNKAKPFTLVLDEFGDYCPADFARVLTGSRKFRVGIVFAHQNLGQLITKDQDRTLIETALMIPNRIVFGGLPLDEAKLLAQQMYLAELDPEAIKYWPETVTWDPVPTKVVNYGESHSGSDTRAEGGAAGEGGGDVDSESVSTDPETGDAVGHQAGASRSSSWSRSSQWSFSSSTSWSKTAQEAWVTFYKERIQKGTPVYRQIDEQVFTFARDLVLAPVGQGVLNRRGERPVTCRVPHMKDIDYTDDEIAAFLEAMYAKEQYRLPAAVDELLVARERKLLEFTDPQVVPDGDATSEVRQSARRKPPRRKGG